jgi:hypothetical protein
MMLISVCRSVGSPVMSYLALYPRMPDEKKELLDEVEFN